MSAPHWMDGMVLQNETADDFELVPAKQYDCDDCEDEGEVDYDEYSKEGQLIGVGTLTKKCVCRMNNDDGDDPQDER